MASIVSSEPLREEDTSARECTAFSTVVEFAVGLNVSASLVLSRLRFSLYVQSAR